MSETLIPPFRTEVQNYLRLSEDLLFIGASQHTSPFSERELEVMKHYAHAMAKMVSKLGGI